MELIFLDRKNFNYKDHAFVSDDFELVVDMVVSQKSNFIVNKVNINASIGDIVTIKSSEYSYIGVIQTIELVDGVKTKIQSNDFKELFNVKTPINSYFGDVCLYIKEIIEGVFIKNSDNYQNMNYLKITCNYSVEGALNFSEDNIMSITDLIELVNRDYGINIKYKVHFLRGRFTNLEIIIDNVSTDVKIKDNLSCISDVVISDSNEQMINKVVFYPKSTNVTYTSEQIFYLLTDGSITTKSDHPDRFTNVCFTSEYYADNDFQKLETKARGIMASKGLDHGITFKINMNNNFIKPLNNLFLGDYVEYISKNKTYNTVLTQFKFKGGFEECYVTLGEFRNKLTDKIKILTKNTNASIKNQGVSTSTPGNIDGGTY